MSAVIVYTYPTAAVSSDNLSATQKTTLVVKDCSADSYTNDCPPGWNDTLCASDSAYCTPFERGDVLCHQFRFNPRRFTSIELFYVDCEAAENPEQPLPAEWYTWQTGFDPNNKGGIQNLCINTAEIPTSVRCFYLLLKVYGCRNPVLGVECSEPVLLGTRCTEPYCEVKCNQETLLMESSYSKYDCFGNYYGPLTGNIPNIFSNAIRVPANIESDNFVFSETYVGLTVTAKSMKERFTLRTYPVPPYVAERMAWVAGGMDVTIDGTVYEELTTLEKNNEDGRMWIIKTTCAIKCENNFTCQ
jgi:hypothetical protein